MRAAIASYNRRQVAFGCLRILAGLIAYGLTFAFFYWAAGFCLRALGLPAERWGPIGAGALAVLVLTVTGIQRWRNGQEYLDFRESLASSLPEGSALRFPEETHAVASAYWISRIFLAGPIQLFKAAAHFRSRLPGGDAVLPARLEDMLVFVRGRGSWHPVEEYRGSEEEIGYLIRLGLVEFSPRTGRLRAVREGAEE